MPRWPQEMVDCTVFMYETAQDADLGTHSGGAGFLVAFAWESNPKKSHLYAVTNYHVAISGRASVIRLNTKDGRASGHIETEPGEWFWRTGHDVAIYRIDSSRHPGFFSLYDFKALNFEENNLTQKTIDDYNLGIGDDVVSAGRFVDLSGTQRNEPLIRSGIISLMGPVSVRQDKDAVPWESELFHIAEMRSRTGFSGSPVYIYIDQLALRMVGTRVKVSPWTVHGPWLLGIQSGQYPLGTKKDEAAAFGTSMVTVVPCSALADLLSRDKRVIAERREYEARFNAAPSVSLEAVRSPKADENPRHKEDFTSLLDAATRGNKPTDQT
ncbi:MAG: S1 family peptidase [Alphaproteobacteria bacterium]